MTDLLERVEEKVDILPYEPDDGKDRRTHIVNPPANTHIWREGMTTQDVVDIARATGQHVVTLCGYKFVPKRNPEAYDMCQNCFEIAQRLMAEAGE